MSDNKGFTLTELVVVMGIFMVLLIISASAFERVVSTSSVVGRSVESQMEGVVGLEMLRRDLNAAGFGLPWSFEDPAITYAEIDTAGMCPDSPIKKICSGDLNNAPSAVPQAFSHTIVPDTAGLPILGGGNDSIKGSDYLAIRSTSVAFNNSAGKWSFVRYSGSTASNSSYVVNSAGTGGFVAGEALITLVDTFSNTNPIQRRLAMVSPTSFSYKTDSAAVLLTPPNDKYKPSGSIAPGVDNEKLLVYGLNNFASGSADTIQMPFNRVDYFVRRPITSMPATCNPGTGILYKGVVINSTSSDGGGMTSYPLVDCVGDMQVVFDLRPDATSLSKTSPSDTLAGLTAADIRSRLKSVRIYILAHEGHRDTNYTYPYSDANNVIHVGDPWLKSLGRTFTAAQMLEFFGSNWRQYRWKVYTIAGQPYNLTN